MSATSAFCLQTIESLDNFVGRADFSLEKWGVTAQFSGGEDSYIVSYQLPEPQLASGVTATFQLRGWNDIKYMAIGYIHNGKYCHIKSMNIRKEAWVSLGFQHDDIIYQLQNNEANLNDNLVSGIRLFVKGTPSENGSQLDIKELACLLSAKPEEKIAPRAIAEISDDVLELLIGYLKNSFKNYKTQARDFLVTGGCPAPGNKQLEWALDAAIPVELEKVNTYRFSWHAHHPAIQLLLLAEDSQELAPVFSARSLIEQWLMRSFYQKDGDIKFAWYDHGTAERLLAFLLMWNHAVHYKMDNRFIGQLKSAIIKHAELLSSEAFYAYNQPSRYHNHAWFQDAALIATALAFSDLKQSAYWLDTAINRFEDQLDTLIVRDGGFAIFVENSIGYHHGVQRLTELVGALVSLSGRKSEISKIAQELIAWSDFLRYPDGRAPAQGDTFRLPPRTGNDICRGKAWEAPSCVVLPKAGYAVLKDNYDEKPWMLCLFNTSISQTHKHEDNLTLTFWFDGIEWIIDPSFYSHEYLQDLPSNLRRALSHNGICLGADYASKSSFKTSLTPKDGKTLGVKGEHGAYTSCSIVRDLTVIGTGQIGITDFIQNSIGENIDPSVNFIFAENVKASIEENNVALTSPDSCYSVVLNFNGCEGHIQLHERQVGVGFLQSESVDSLHLELNKNNTLSWSINIKKNANDNSVIPQKMYRAQR